MLLYVHVRVIYLTLLAPPSLPCNALPRGYSNAAVVLLKHVPFCPCVTFEHVNMINRKDKTSKCTVVSFPNLQNCTRQQDLLTSYTLCLHLKLEGQSEGKFLSAGPLEIDKINLKSLHINNRPSLVAVLWMNYNLITLLPTAQRCVMTLTWGRLSLCQGHYINVHVLVQIVFLWY